MVKILLVEDQNVVRNGIRALLDKEEDIEVIAEAGNGKDALQFLKDGYKPDIILTAINLPQMGGIELLTRVCQAYHGIKVVMLSMYDEDKYISQAFKAGAKGYMLKSVNASELLFGIRHIQASNDRYLCNLLALKLLDRFLHTPDNSIGVDINELDISQREIEILSLVSEGFTNQEIADTLFTSRRTIESHRQNLIDKTGTRNTAALVRYAVLNNIIR